jgi:calcineurin-like phosphoesterase family protein
MSSIAIGDIHGNFQALDDLLSQVAPTVTERDNVIFLGDYIDRGPDSCRCIDRILRFRQESSATVVTLRGNHEDWLLATLRDYTDHSWLLAMDVFPTIESYSREAADVLRSAMTDAGSAALYDHSTRLPYDAFFTSLPQTHIEFLESLKLLHETEDGVFVHAGLDTRVRDLQHQPRFALLMGTFDFVDGYRGPPVVVYGHRNNASLRDGWPHPNASTWTIGLDTIAHGVLTAVRLPDRTVIQSARYRASAAS